MKYVFHTINGFDDKPFLIFVRTEKKYENRDFKRR